MTTVEAPYDAEVEYLESTGTQWIDTGIYGTQNTIADMRGCNLNFNSYSWGFGSRVAWANRMFCLSNGQDQGFRYTFGWGNGSGVSSAVSQVSATTGIMADFVIAQQCSVDGQVLPAWVRSSFQTPGTLRIFGIYADGSMVCGKWRFSNVRITVQGNTVRDLIPIRFTNELGQSEGAMYDKVSGQLFRNQGTGAFKYGADVRPYSTPVMGLHFMRGPLTARDYIQDGLIAMWDGIENSGWGVHDASATAWKDLISGRFSDGFSSTETVEDQAVITTTREFILIDDVEAVASSISTLTVQRVAQEIIQSSFNNAAGGVLFCAKRFGAFMYFRHVPGDGGYGCGPMGYNFPPRFGSFGRGFYNPSDTYPLQSRTMVVGAQGNPIAAYDGTTRLSDWGQGLNWGSATTSVKAGIAASISGRYRNCSIRVYNRALTAEDIAANYAIDRERFNLP